MRRLGSLLPAVLLTSAAAQPSVGPLPPEARHLPAESLLLGVDVKSFFASDAWALLAGAASEQAGSRPPQTRDGMASWFQAIEATTGVRIDQQVDRATLMIGGLNRDEPLLAVAAAGRFDPARVNAALQASYEAEGGARARRGAGGSVVFEEGGLPEFAAWVDARTLILGSPEPVERAVTDRAQGITAPAASPGLVRLLKTVTPGSGLWLVADRPLIDKVAPMAGGAGPPFARLRTLTLSVDFDGGFEITGEVADEATARQIRDVILDGISGGLAAAAQSGRSQGGLLSFWSSIVVQQEAQTLRVVSRAAGSGTAGLGLVAAIAIPTLLRARISANEAAVIADVRAVIAAQAAYAGVNKGSYGALRCLSEPEACRPGYDGPGFADASLTSLADRSAYKRAFFPGNPGRAGPASYASYAYTATPVERGRTGVRSFCGDSTGVVCFDPTGAAIQPLGGACPSTCTPLE